MEFFSSVKLIITDASNSQLHAWALRTPKGQQLNE